MAKTLKEKQQIYRTTFQTETGKQVLTYLRDFCYATRTTGGNVSDSAMREREGRRQVFMEIMTTMKVDFEDYYEYVDDGDLI